MCVPVCHLIIYPFVMYGDALTKCFVHTLAVCLGRYTLLFAIFNVSIFIFTQNKLFFLGRGQRTKKVRVHLHPIAKLTIIIERYNNNQLLKKMPKRSERAKENKWLNIIQPCVYEHVRINAIISFYPLSLWSSSLVWCVHMCTTLSLDPFWELDAQSQKYKLEG